MALSQPDITRIKHPGLSKTSTLGARCRRKFLHYFPGGFKDETYLAWERDYKWTAHQRWIAELERDKLRALLERGAYAHIAARAVSVESRTNLLFSFEKMALRDALKVPAGARAFSHGLYDWLHGDGGGDDERSDRWCDVVAELPRKQTRVLTWPIATVFGFIAQPSRHVFMKPMVMKRAAAAYGFELAYASRPSWASYASLLAFARKVRADLRDLRARDMIDIQSFLWVLGSDEYP